MSWSKIKYRLRLMWEEMAATGLEWPGEGEEQPVRPETQREEHAGSGDDFASANGD